MPQKHTFRASKGDGGFTHAQRPGCKGDSGFSPATRCTEKATNAPVHTPLRRRAPPQNLARNSIGQSFNRVRKRCNPNDLNSMFERVAGELRAKLLGGGGAWPGFETTRQATPRNASAAGVEGAGETCRGAGGRWRGLAGLRGAAPSEARGADGSRAGRRPPAHTAARPNSTPRNANARQPRGAAARSRSQSSTQRSRCATTSATWTAFKAAPLRRLSPETTKTRPRLPSTA